MDSIKSRFRPASRHTPASLPHDATKAVTSLTALAPLGLELLRPSNTELVTQVNTRAAHPALSSPQRIPAPQRNRKLGAVPCDPV